MRFMLDLKLAVASATLGAIGTNLSDTDGTVEGIIGKALQLGATGVVGIIAWRLIEVHGKAIDRNSDAVDRMREHCSAKNGEAKDGDKGKK